MKRKSGLPVLWLTLTIISALLISLLAVYLVSSRQRVREIEIRDDLRTRVLNLADNLETRCRDLCEEALADAVQRLGAVQAGANPLPAIKAISMRHEVIRHPFWLRQDGTYAFPFSRSAASPILQVPQRVPADEKIAVLYRQGKNRERMQDFPGAIRAYLRALERNKDATLIAYLDAAVARAYLKMGRLPQAERFFMRCLRALPGEKRKAADLFVITKRQLALIAKLEGKPELALARYVDLYDISLAMEPLADGKRYEFFRNEAADFIESDSRKRAATPARDLSGPIVRFMKTRSSLDLSLQWLYFDFDTEAAGAVDSTDAESRRDERIRLSDLYSSAGEKTRFYRAVKSAPFWTGLETESGRSFYRTIHVAGDEIRLCMIRIDPEGYFGFAIAEAFIRERLMPSPARQYIAEKGLSVRLASTNGKDDATLPGYPLLSVPLEYPAGNSRLFVVASSPNYLRTRIHREMVVNYLMIAVLVLFMAGGITLWLRHIRAERKRVQSKGEFLTLAAHTLRTPITRLSLLAENLRSGWEKDPETRNEFLDSIGNEARRMNELIENLLNFARIDEGQKRYVKKKIRLSGIVLEVLSRHDTFLRSTGFSVETEIETDIPPQWLDPEAMDMLVAGLLQNAVKYSADKKRIDICLKREGTDAVLSIADRGIGILAAETEKVFARFFRSESSAVRAIEGSGLGLFLARHAVAAHGGTITVTSKPGKGTVFSVRLPIPGSREDSSPRGGRSQWKRS